MFNLCDSEHYTQYDIYEAAADALEIPLRFRRVPSFAASIAHLTGKVRAHFDRYDKFSHLLEDQNLHTGVSCEKARRVLGFEPQQTPRFGIQQAVEWCRDEGWIDF